jgi:hypothetical protein
LQTWNCTIICGQRNVQIAAKIVTLTNSLAAAEVLHIVVSTIFLLCRKNCTLDFEYVCPVLDALHTKRVLHNVGTKMLVLQDLMVQRQFL